MDIEKLATALAKICGQRHLTRIVLIYADPDDPQTRVPGWSIEIGHAHTDSYPTIGEAFLDIERRVRASYTKSMAESQAALDTLDHAVAITPPSGA